MSSELGSSIRRREFLKKAGATSVLGLADARLDAFSGRIVIVADKTDPHVQSRPVQWAIDELRRAIESRQVPVAVVSSPGEASDGSLYIVVAGSTELSKAPEAFALRNGKIQGKPAVLVDGADGRGFVYGLLELADRVRLGGDLPGSLTSGGATEGKPANQIRSIARAFVSDVEDKSWYYDKTFWRNYLTELVANRFNRFSLTFGLGYNFPRGVTEDYFHFPYPYLFEVPGYKVRVTPLSDAERDKNLEMLKFITEETARRGLDCQIGIWTHAYQWVDSPNSAHHVEGLTPETHAPYCRDALALLLKSCPAIQGLTLRVHGESGIPEGSYSFWQTLFEAITRSGRQIEIDMHAKGLDSTMIDIALKTGMPIKVSPKYWAEHMGLGYHQAAIREVEMPRSDGAQEGVFKLSNGSRRFLRYGYGDLFQKDRRFDVLFRIWPGTQRTLLWGDPALASGYGRSSHFCGASGIEIFEPLFFKGRQGSGIAGGRCAYADESLKPADDDWSKFRYTYRIWGRNLYNPDADPEEWRRYLRAKFGGDALSMEKAVSHASRILPLITTAHLPSASNDSYWPEMYTNMPIFEGSEIEPYSDTPAPKRFGTVSPLDPELFSTIEQHASALLDGNAAGKYSPIEVAQWLENLSETANQSLAGRGQPTPELRRFEEDIRIQIGLGEFFAAKLRSGVLYDIYKRTGDGPALQEAVTSYRKARSAWSAMANRAGTVYRSDVTFGRTPIKRGHWLDRLPAIDKDLAAMEALIANAKTPSSGGAQVKNAILAATGRPQRPSTRCTHTPPRSFQPGEPVSITIALTHTEIREQPSAIRLRYRQVNQAERWKAVDMERTREGYSAAIPGTYSKSPYALQYYFEFRRDPHVAWIYPGFDANLANQPYFLVGMAG
ncbi:MAG TPA: hypothetical protein VK493_11125 [Bryobacteraceae bacterium]|nr:hypothetical protein [Bryobacteraceae bacterium]